MTTPFLKPPCRRLALLLTDGEIHDFFPGQLGRQLQALDPLPLPSGDPLAARDALARAAPEVLLTGWSTPPLKAILPPSVRYVCHLTGSVKHLVDRSQIEQGLLVTNWGDSISRTVAEAALWHILMGLRNGTHWTLAMHCEGAWTEGRPCTASLFGRRVGIHGFGNVARCLVRLLEPFGCQVSAFAPDIDAPSARAAGVTPARSLEELFSSNDVVVELAPLIPETRGVVTAALLERLRPGSVFVNVGRGLVVDEAALLRVAQRGEVAFGLDVFAVEPLPPDSALRRLRNVSLSPHFAGPTTDRCPDAGAYALVNLQAYAAGRPLRALITPAIYDVTT